MKQLPITVVFTQEQQQAQATALPQAQLLTGATGYILAIQIGSTVFTSAIAPVIQGLVEASKPAPKSEEDNEQNDVAETA